MAAEAIYEVSQFVFPAHATVVKCCKFCAEPRRQIFEQSVFRRNG